MPSGDTPHAPPAWPSPTLPGKFPVQSQFNHAEPVRLPFLTRRDFGGNHATESEKALSRDQPGRKATTELSVSTTLGQRPNGDPPCEAPGRERWQSPTRSSRRNIASAPPPRPRD